MSVPEVQTGLRRLGFASPASARGERPLMEPGAPHLQAGLWSTGSRREYRRAAGGDAGQRLAQWES